MHFSVVAERPHVLIFNRTGRARDALRLASARREDGFEAVHVYDSSWSMIGASNLSEAARAEIEANPTDANADSVSTTWRVGGRKIEPERPEGSKPESGGRVRVFRIRRPGAA